MAMSIFEAAASLAFDLAQVGVCAFPFSRRGREDPKQAWSRALVIVAGYSPELSRTEKKLEKFLKKFNQSIGKKKPHTEDPNSFPGRGRRLSRERAKRAKMEPIADKAD